MQASGIEGWFLTQAFNSSRFFAFVERTWFSTPYCHGNVRVEIGPRAAAEVAAGGGGMSVAMRRDVRERAPMRAGREAWSGPIFLPRPCGLKSPPKHFYAKLEGDAQAFPFALDGDAVIIVPTTKWPVFSQLAAANFRGVEWLLRPDAVHARSRTYDGRPARSLS